MISSAFDNFQGKLVLTNKKRKVVEPSNEVKTLFPPSLLGAEDNSLGNIEMMITDVEIDEKSSERPGKTTSMRNAHIFVYGVLSDGTTCCCHIKDFSNYFWIIAPKISRDGKELDCTPEEVQHIANFLNQKCKKFMKKGQSQHGEVVQLALENRKPLMFYRPEGLSPFLKVQVSVGVALSKVAEEVSAMAESNKLSHLGITWRDWTTYEVDVKLGMRFLCDSKLSGGSWVRIQNAFQVNPTCRSTVCHLEVEVTTWKHLKGLTADGTQFFKRQQDQNLAIDKHFCSIPPLPVMTIHVLAAGNVNWNGKSEAVSHHIDTEIEKSDSVTIHKWAVPERDPILFISCRLGRFFESKILHDHHIAFTSSSSRSRGFFDSKTEIRSFTSEMEMLRAFVQFFVSEADPTLLCAFQVRDSLAYLVRRFKHLKLGPLVLGRRVGKASKIRSVVSYGKQWVVRQARMSATSNQETFQVHLEGRIVVDMLRSILTEHNLSAFSLAECSQVFLGETKEDLPSSTIGQLWAGKFGGVQRIMRYCYREAEVAEKLMGKLGTLTQLVEMARVTGVQLADVLYKAQMIRVQSLILRAASLENWILCGPIGEGQLSEGPFLLHPKEANTAGFYQDPVAVLDFASLYPSIFIAHNLCYCTLVAPGERKKYEGKEGEFFESPTGELFAPPSLQEGLLPRICSSLIRSRQLAKTRAKDPSTSQWEASILAGREKALKLCANALYGFTGALPSPMRAVEIANSCLSLGSHSLQKAMALVKSQLPPSCEIIYAQTDSIFVHFPQTSLENALSLAKEVAEKTSLEFPHPMELKFERVLCPFLLLQVNRYAGMESVTQKLPESSVEKLQKNLFTKGVEVDRRDVPLFVQDICRDVLLSLLNDDNVPAALDRVKEGVKNLMSGKYSLREVMLSGGLWRVDESDISRMALNPKSTTKKKADEGRGPHVSLAVRLKRKDPDRTFHIGERIPFVLLRDRGELQDEMAEDPKEALLNGFSIHSKVYLENKLRKPLESILEHFIPSHSISQLFSGEHSMDRPLERWGNNNPKQKTLKSFFKSSKPCLTCRTPLSGAQGGICEECLELGKDRNFVYNLLIQQKESEERLFKAASNCINCHSGGHMQLVLCTSVDCPFFYDRFEAERDLKRVELKLHNLKLL